MTQSNRWEAFAVIVAVIFGIGSCIQSCDANKNAENANNLSGKANQTAEEANKIASEANNLSQEANTIAKRQLNSMLFVEIVDGRFSHTTLSRRKQQKNIKFFPINSLNSPYSAYFLKDFHLFINNLGLQSDYIKDFRLYECRTYLNNKSLTKSWSYSYGTEESVLLSSHSALNLGSNIKEPSLGSSFYLFNLDGKKVSGFKKIERNEPIELVLKVRYLIPKQAWQKTNLKLNKVYSYEQAEHEFDTHGFRLFGQFTPKDKASSDDIGSTQSGFNEYHQIFKLIIEKSDGQKIYIPFGFFTGVSEEFVSSGKYDERTPPSHEEINKLCPEQ